MTVFNLGSINLDHFYQVPSLPMPGETVAAKGFFTGLGGKGANQSVAAALGGAKVVHIGAVGPDGDFAIEKLRAAGVETSTIARLDIPTGQAVVAVDPQAENAIIIFSSANVAQTRDHITRSLEGANPGDILILQNETNLVRFTAELARSKGMMVVYSAAPFDPEKVREVIDCVDLLVLNEVEAAQLSASFNADPDHLPVAETLITYGAEKAVLLGQDGRIEMPSFPVEPVDTTGAGDTYIGYFVAQLDCGSTRPEAMKLAAAAAAIQVTRPGTADAIPGLDDVRQFLNAQREG